jgi:DNA-binding response OmpR family regulator
VADEKVATGLGRVVLVVEDEGAIRELIHFHLARAGFSVAEAQDGLEALAAWQSARPDLVVLDLMLPEMDGLAVCRAIRRQAMTPILMLTAKGDEADRVSGLDLGADDYMVKPFSPKELVARVRALLRRTAPTDELLRIGALVLDRPAQRVTVAGEAVTLTLTEFSLLRCLIEHPGRVLSRRFLLQEVWGYDFFGDSRTVDVHIHHLREKIGERSDVLIETVRGAGYRLVGEER